MYLTLASAVWPEQSRARLADPDGPDRENGGTTIEGGPSSDIVRAAPLCLQHAAAWCRLAIAIVPNATREIVFAPRHLWGCGIDLRCETRIHQEQRPGA